MKKLFLTFFISLTALVSLNAQSLVLCGDYDKTTGKPSDVFTNWDVNPTTGSYVYVIYSQEKKIKGELRLKVEHKDATGMFVNKGIFSFAANENTEANWAMYDLLFKEIGDYKLSVLDKTGAVLASTNANIAFTAGSEEGGIVDDKEMDTFYYENSIVRFGISANKNELIGEGEVFKLTNGVAKFTALLEQDEDLLLTTVYIDIYKGEELIKTDSFTVGDKAWNYITLPIEMTETGDFYIDFYNQNDVFMNSGSFTIN